MCPRAPRYFVICVAAGGHRERQENRPHHCNFLGLKQFDVTSKDKLPAGPHQVRIEFAYDGGGLGKAAPRSSTSMANRLVTAGSNERTHAFFLSMEETMEIGCDVGEPVSPD